MHDEYKRNYPSLHHYAAQRYAYFMYGGHKKGTAALEKGLAYIGSKIQPIAANVSEFGLLIRYMSLANLHQNFEPNELCDSDNSLVRAVSSLPYLDRSVFLLVFVEGLSDRETAHILGQPLKAIEAAVDRSMAALEEIDEEDIETGLTNKLE